MERLSLAAVSIAALLVASVVVPTGGILDPVQDLLGLGSGDDDHEDVGPGSPAGDGLVHRDCGEDPYGPAGCDYRHAMRQFIQNMSVYAKAVDPAFAIIPQNGGELISLDDEPDGPLAADYASAIDGQSQETMHFGDPTFPHRTPSDDHDYQFAWIDRFRQEGFTVWVPERTDDPDDIAEALAESEAHGFVGYASPTDDYRLIPDDGMQPWNEHDGSVSSFAATKNFLYLINPEHYDEDEEPDLVLTLDATNYDAFLIDANINSDEWVSRAQTDALATKPNGEARVVISYMSIGEAEDYRYYWDDRWFADPPLWMAEQPTGDNSPYVRYWSSEWQAQIFGDPDSYLDRILAAGFDGVYIDIVDAFDWFEYKMGVDYPPEDGAGTGGSGGSGDWQPEPMGPSTDPTQEMRWLIEDISMHARAAAPGFQVVVVDGVDILTDDRKPDGPLNEDYRWAINGVVREFAHYGYQEYDEPTDPEDTQSMEEDLDRALAEGLAAWTFNVAWTPSNVDDAYAQADAGGYVGFVSDDGSTPSNVPAHPATAHRAHMGHVHDVGAASNWLLLNDPDGDRDDMLDALRATDHDVVVVSLFDEDGGALNAAEVASLKTKASGGDRLVLASINVARADVDAPWFDAGWMDDPPAWFYEHPADDDSPKVYFWYEEWRDLLFGAATALVDQAAAVGFDGVFLDDGDGHKTFL